MNSYNARLQAAVDEYKNAYLSPLPAYRTLPSRPADVVGLLGYQKTLSNRLRELSDVRIEPLSFDILSDVNDKYKRLEAERLKQIESLKENAEIEKQTAIANHEQELKDIAAHNQSLINPLKAKHNELLACKDELSYVFKHYEITPLDINISDGITIDEFGTLIDESLATCHKYIKKDNTWFDKIIAPLKDETRLEVVVPCVLLAIVVIYLAMPLLALVAFPLMFKSIHNMYKDMEKLKIAAALMTQIDYNRFVPEEEFKQPTELDISYIDENLNKALSSVHDYSAEKDTELSQVTNESAEIAKICTEAQSAVKAEYAAVITLIKNAITEAENKINEIMKTYKQFPTVMNDSVVMSHNYVLGRIENRLDVSFILPAKNIVFDARNRANAIEVMKLYLANALLSVRVKQLTVEIFDPKNMCSEFVDFFNPDTKDYIIPNNDTLDNLIKTYREYSQQNILVLDNKSIDDFNKDAEKRELVPKAYKLLLIVSEFDKLKKGDEERLFEEWFKFSAESGCMVWLLDTKKRANALWVDGSYSNEGEALRYNSEIGKQAVKTFATALAKFKDRGIDYVSKFGEVYIPRDKWWTFDTIKGIKMPFGLENGDPTRGLNVAPVIGDGNVHALLGGATGAGKSAAINQLLISLTTMYPPSELQLVYIDFKNVEAAKFTRGYDHKNASWLSTEVEKELRDEGDYYSRLSRIPHLRIISGTTDGEYALSVFEFLMAEMAHRQEIINKFGVTKIQEMREQILANYNLEHNGDKKKGSWSDMRKDWAWYKPNVYDKYGDLPRLLVIFDEFQVMYNPEFVPQKIIDQINGKITAITKLARAMAAHFWFTSQSMKGTMPKDTMANFSLRGALRCTEDVSNELLGNKAASTIKPKFGFMYTNDSAGQDPGANHFWRVPFLDEKKMPEYIDTMIKMLPEFNETHDMAEFYDEKILVPSKQLDDWYEVYPDAFRNPGTFILGERASYSTNKAPVTLSLLEDTGENVMVAAFDRNDMLNLTMTMIKNLQRKEDVTIVLNCQDAEAHTLIDANSLVQEALRDLTSPKQDIEEFVAAIEDMVGRRVEVGGPYKPVYIFCMNWERAPKISVDVNYKFQDRFKDLIRQAPTVGVHFIFSCREKLDMPRMIPAACNHRVCGLLPKDAFVFIEDTRVEKLPDASKDCGLFAIYEFGTSKTKFRIYQHKYTKQIQSREIVL